MQMQTCKPVQSPSVAHKVSVDDTPLLGPDLHHMYRSVVGKLAWAAGERTDLLYTTKELARKLNAPTVFDFQRLKRAVRYVSGTMHLVERVTPAEATPNFVEVHADADWATGPDRRSTSGVLVWWRGVLLLAKSRTQTSIALSSCEAELIAMHVGAVEATFIVHLVEALGYQIRTRIYSDSQAAIAFAFKRGVGRQKHLDIRRLWIQDEVRHGRIALHFLESRDQYADLLTKPQPKILERLAEVGLYEGVRELGTKSVPDSSLLNSLDF